MSFDDYRPCTVWQTVPPWPVKTTRSNLVTQERPERIDDPQMALRDKTTIGLAPRSLAVLKHIANNPAATVSEIAKSLEITSQHASNSVVALVASGRIRRDVERLQYNIPIFGNRIHRYFINDHPNNGGIYQ